MSFQNFRKHSSSKQNERIKILLQRLEKFESEANPVENNNLFALGFTSRGYLSYHDDLAFSRLHIIDENDYLLPVEPDGQNFVLWWTFDGLTELEDRAFFGHTGEVFGPIGCGALAEGVNEGIGAGGTICSRFDGESKYIKTLSSTETDTIGELGITNKTQFSIFVRFKTDDPFDGQVLVEKNDDLSSNFAYRIAITSGKLIFVVRRNGSNTVRTISTTLAADTWYDAWFTADTTTLNIYVNGTEVSTTGASGGFSPGGFGAGFDTGFDLTVFEPITTFGTGTAFLVGTDVGLGQFFKGYIQDVRFWKNKVINSTEVSNMWTNKVTISDIMFERVAVVGLATTRIAQRRIISEPLEFSDALTPTFLLSNPHIKSISEDLIDFEDEPFINVSVTKPTSIQSEETLFDDTITIFRGSLQVKVGNIVKSTQTSGLPNTVNYSTEIGFRPKFILFFGSIAQSYDEYYRDPRTFIGFTDGTNNRGLSAGFNDDTSDMDSAKGLYDSAIVHVQHGNNLEVLATCTFSENGFSLRYTNNVSSARIINYVAFGGSVITNVKVGHFAQPASATGAHAVTGVGFEPDLVMLLPTQFTSINTKSVNGALLFGAFNNVFENFSLAVTDVDGASTSVSKRIARSDRAITLLGSETTGLNTVMKSASVTDTGSDGFTLNYDVNGAAGSAAGLCAYAALKGIQTFIGKFTPTSGTGIQVIEEPNMGFKPSVIIFVGHGKTVENNTTPSAELRMGIGVAVDSLNRRCDTLHVRDNASDGICVNYARSNRTFVLFQADSNASSSTVIFAMDFVSSVAGGFTINKSVNTLGTNNDINYIAIA